ncbi:DNA-processing protein DprA [Cytobacillus sp. Hm23]
MDTFRKTLIHLHHCRGIGWRSIKNLLTYDPNLTKIYQSSFTDLRPHLPISTTQLKNLMKDLHSSNIQSMLNKYSDYNIHIVTIFDDEYPNMLKQIYDPPWVIYAKGDLRLLSDQKCLSVVGARYPSSYGLRSIERVILPLIQSGWTVISGLAKGIDSKAHELALLHKGKTIAVIAGGFQYIYPKENAKLANMISKENLLLSEYPPFVRPERWQFPMRNRIISGLSFGTVIIEARESSGSLITADQALEQGREVFAIPGSIFAEHSIGTNKLIQQGAKLVMSSNDIEAEIISQI